MARKDKVSEATSELIVAPTNVVASQIPDYLQKYKALGNVGLENINSDDLVMPRLAIAQSKTPQVDRTESLYIPDLEVGDFFNTITNEIYGPGPIFVTPLLQFPHRIYFAPRGATGPQQLCSTKILNPQGRLIQGQISPDGCDLCPHSNFLTVPRPDGSTRPDCTFFYSYVVAIHKRNGDIELAVFSVKSKMLKPAKKWNSMMKIRIPRLPGFTMVFSLRTTPEKAARGTFFNFIADNPPVDSPFIRGNVPEQILYKTEEMFQELSNRDIDVDIRGIDKEDEDLHATNDANM